MKTTIEIHDQLMARAKRYAKRSGRPLRAVIEDGLRLVLAESESKQRYRLPDCSAGDPDAPDPLDAWTWQDLRDEIYTPSRSR